MSEEKMQAKAPRAGMVSWRWLLIGVVVGGVLCAGVMISVMPSMMIVTSECHMDVDQTVAALEERITQQGWSVKGVRDVQAEIRRAGYVFEPKVKLVKLCKADYARDVLSGDRYVSCLMPCTMSVWQGDDGKTYLSRMNMGLMARMFGGNIRRVMGGDVVRDEAQMLEGLLVDH